MIYKVFAIRDSKAEAYMPPFCMRTLGEMERTLTQMCSQPEHNFNKFAEDFTVFYLGTFDDQSCSYSLLDSPVSHGPLLNYKK